MTDFVVTQPKRGKKTLHVRTCEVLKRARVPTPALIGDGAPYWATYPDLWVNDYTLACTVCTTPLLVMEAEQQAEVAKAESNSRDEWRYIQQRGDTLESFHKFVPLRDAVQAAWASPVWLEEERDYRGRYDLQLKLDTERWSGSGRIYLKVEGDRVVFVDINHSTGLIEKPEDAYALVDVFHAIENFRLVRGY